MRMSEDLIPCGHLVGDIILCDISDSGVAQGSPGSDAVQGGNDDQQG